MRKPFVKRMPDMAFEEAHGGSGRRQLVLHASNKDDITPNLEALAHTILEAGFTFDWHDHPGLDEFFIALGGEGRVTFEDGSVIDYKKGDVVYMPTEQKHKIEALGTEASEFYFVRVAR